MGEGEERCVVGWQSGIVVSVEWCDKRAGRGWFVGGTARRMAAGLCVEYPAAHTEAGSLALAVGCGPIKLVS